MGKNDKKKGIYEKNKTRKNIFIIVISLIIFWYFFGPVYSSPNVDEQSEWYVNDIYMSDQYYYENLLNDEEKSAYKTLFEKLNNMEQDIYLNLSVESFIKVWDSIICDHPEMININGMEYDDYSNEQISSVRVKPKYLTKSEFLLNNKVRTVRKKVGKIVSKTEGMSEFEKEKYVYEWLAKKILHGHSDLDNYQSAYGVFSGVTNKTNGGYAKTIQILLSNVGVKSIVNINNDHTWNTVKLDGEYYYMDVNESTKTRSNYKGNISYLGLNNNKYTSNYELLYPSIQPDVSGTKYNYYEYNNVTLTYSEETLPQLKAIIDSSEYEIVEVRFTNEAEARKLIRTQMEYLGLKDIQASDDYHGVIMLVKNSSK